MIDPALSDFRGEHRTEPVPPKPHRFVADIDPALEQQIFYLPQRQRIAAYIITVRRIASGELLKQRNGFASPEATKSPSRLKPICSDTARPPYAQRGGRTTPPSASAGATKPSVLREDQLDLVAR
jgi:hypothetical protein